MIFCLSPKQCGLESAKELRVTRVKTERASLKEHSFDQTLTGIQEMKMALWCIYVQLDMVDMQDTVLI